MIPLLHLFLGAITFVAQDVSGVQVGRVNPLTGTATVNYLHADFDQDGNLDLLLPREVVFHRENGFRSKHRVSLPVSGKTAMADVWDNALYLRTEMGLGVYMWRKGGWEKTFAQRLVWPPTFRIPTPPSPFGQAAPAIDLQPFLHDLDDDGVPEILTVDESAIYLFRREKEEYALAVQWEVFPPLMLMAAEERPVWPASARRIAFPARQMACRWFLDGDALSVLTRHRMPEETVQYRCVRHRLDPVQRWSLKGEATREESQPLAAYLRPCRLNGDDVIDYAGGRWELSPSSAVPVMLYETRATLDGGHTYHVRRTRTLQARGARPHCSFVDFDGDGDADMVTEATHLYDGGIREAAARFRTARKIQHELLVYRQNPAGFSKRPALQAQFDIQLLQAPIRDGLMFRRYRNAEILDLTGDFNGDGYRDLVVRERLERLSVHLAAGFAFAPAAEATVSIPAAGRFGVADVDGDGRSDIVLRWTGTPETGGGERSRVFFSREGFE